MLSYVLDPHMILNVTPTSLQSRHVYESPCLGAGLWQAWVDAGLEGTVRAHPAPQDGLRLSPVHREKHIKDPFYSINVSWSNVSHVCTFLDFL